MPHIVSLLPTAPALPAAAPAPAASAVASGTLLPPDPTSPNFLAQFKAALKTIAKVVVQPQLTQRPATDPNTAPLMSAVPDEKPAAEADKHVDVSMPDLLAQLGFAVVPPTFALPTPPKPMTTGAAGTPAAPERVAQPQLPQSALPLANLLPARLGPVMLQAGIVPLQAAGPEKTQAAPAASEALPTAPLIQMLPDAQLGQALADAHLGQTLLSPQPGQTRAARPIGPETISDLRRGQPGPDVLGQALPHAAPLSAPVTHQPIEHLKPSDQPQSPTPQPSLASTPDLSAAVQPQPAPGAHLPTSAAPAATVAPQIGFVPPAAPGGSQSGDARRDHGRHAADTVASISPDGAPVQSAPASDTALAAAAAMAAPVSAGPLPGQVGPSEVVSQIARHADVIRLPGNRGLHIQLHPDDLGGVQVTVRYAPGGGVELHINAEHAATGALVQAGWTELRDALASHGITADRLMMSVTGPPGAGQADLSGGGGNRSDPNSSGSSQGSLSSPDGQSQGQSRQDNAPQRTSQARGGGLEPVASTDDSPRVASVTGSPSRIDYRV